MRRLEDPRVGLAHAAVRGDQRRPVEDLHDLIADRDVDVLAHQVIGHAVAHGVDVDERIMGDAPADSLLTPRQRQILQLIAEGNTTKQIARKLSDSSGQSDMDVSTRALMERAGI